MSILGHSIMFTTILIIVLSLFILIYFPHIKMRSQHKVDHFSEQGIIPEKYITSIRSVIANNQIALFEQVLLPTLTILYTTFDKLQAVSIFEDKCEKVRTALKELKATPGIYTRQSCLNRDTALTAFKIYRIMFADTLECYKKLLNERDHGLTNIDDLILIKRVPERLTRLLGAEYWRLYEFMEAIYGDVSCLRLNSDIAPYLTSNENSEISTLQNQPQKEQVATPSIIKDVALCQKDNALSAEDDITDKEISNKFTTWLLKKINSDDKRYSLNSGDYIYIAPLLYERAVFITEELFNKYYQITAISPDDLKRALSNQGILDDQHYQVKNGNRVILLVRLNKIVIQKAANQIVSIKTTKESDNNIQSEVTNYGNETESSN